MTELSPQQATPLNPAFGKRGFSLLAFSHERAERVRVHRAVSQAWVPQFSLGQMVPSDVLLPTLRRAGFHDCPPCDESA